MKKKIFFILLLLWVMTGHLPAQNTSKETLCISPEGLPEKIIRNKGFVVSYNPVTSLPNWVSYTLTKAEAGASAVSELDYDLMADPALKGTGVAPDGFEDSVFTAGYLASPGDMRWNPTAMQEAFYMTNRCPMDSELLDTAWKELDQKCRYWAKKYGDLHIVAGVIFLESVSPRYVGGTDIRIPDAIFKALLQNRDGKWYSIAYALPNSSCEEGLSVYGFSLLGVAGCSRCDIFPQLTQQERLNVSVELNPKDWEIEGWKTAK